MESLYVCLFSNGHIKVGRSINPDSRIEQHAERVACMGVDLIRKYAVLCPDGVVQREAGLIGRCREAAAAQFKEEWFSGLDFDDVVVWANSCASGEIHIPPAPGATRWSELLTALRGLGWTQMQIAERCGCTRSTVSDLASGKAKDTMYSLGEKLIALHKALTT
jgi:hypothetical protein